MFQEPAFHRAAGQGESGVEVLSRGATFTGAKLKLAHRGMKKRVGSQAIAIGQCPDFLEPTVQAFELPDGDRAILPRRLAKGRSPSGCCRVKTIFPQSVCFAEGDGMNGRDRGLDVKRRQLVAAGRKVQKLQSPRHQRAVPEPQRSCSKNEVRFLAASTRAGNLAALRLISAASA